MEAKLFLPEHVPQVLSFERQSLSPDLSEIQKEMASWESSWREESLNHYSQFGWSFVLQDKNELKGYLLAQPLLFFNKWTQSLWIEHLNFTDPQGGSLLIDTVIRWARTKHLQKVLMNSASPQSSFVLETTPAMKEGNFLHLSTTKMQEDTP